MSVRKGWVLLPDEGSAFPFRSYEAACKAVNAKPNLDLDRHVTTLVVAESADDRQRWAIGRGGILNLIIVSTVDENGRRQFVAVPS